jgi:hypothetical protein
MHHPEHKQLLSLLVRIYHESIRDYYYFPDVIYAGAHKIDADDLRYLLAEGYIEEYSHDSFGRFYTTTKKTEEFIYTMIVSKIHRRKRLRHISVVQCHMNFDLS